jgi:hypothetical protein
MKTSEARKLKIGDVLRYCGQDGKVIGISDTTFRVRWNAAPEATYRFKSGAVAEMNKIDREERRGDA